MVWLIPPTYVTWHPRRRATDRGDVRRMNDKKAAAYRLGFITLAILAVLTIGEFLVAVYMETLVLLFIIALLKAAVIVQNFMHIARLWREEGH